MAVAALSGCVTPSHIVEPADLVDTIGQIVASGDETAYQDFVEQNYAPAVLADSTVPYEASLLSRIYVDTGGFVRLHRVSEASGWVQAEGRARITDIPYCLTIKRSPAEGREAITEISALDLHSAGAELETPEPAELIGEMDRVATAYATQDLFSGVILIARNGEVLFRKAYGYASTSLGIPMRLDTRLNIASIAKVFTGVVIARLVEQGRVSYDDTVGRYWPDYPDPAIRDQVTIRQLLTHTSGLGPEDYYDDPLYPERVASIRSLADYLELAVRTPRNGTPGEYQYNNSGYLILGSIIERITGEDFYDHIQAHVFAPAGMTDSFYAPGDIERLNTAVSLTNFVELPDHHFLFRLGPPHEETAMGAAIGGPQGGAWVTADDLFRFSRALREGRLISAAAFSEMTAGQGTQEAGASGLLGQARPGLGIEVVERNGHTFYGHTGGDFGIASLLYWYPQTGYTTILLSNRDARAPRVLLNLSRAMITRHTVSGDAPPQHCTPPA